MSAKNNRNLFLGIGIFISFTLIIITLNMYFNYSHDLREKTRLTPDAIDDMTIEEIKDFISKRRASEPLFHSFYLLPLVALIGMLMGVLIYYIMSDKVIQRERSLKKNTRIILNFLSGEERKVIETMMEHNGQVHQHDLSHLPNLNKLKTHRILVNLEQKGVIKKEKIGKINKIILNKDLYDVLKNN